MEAEDLGRILALLAEYGQTLDEGRFDDHLEIYADECHVHVFGRDIAGRERIDRFMRQAHRGKHMTGVPRVEVRGDAATSVADFVFFNHEMRLESAGSYRDELVRTPGGWRIRSRTIDIQMRAEE